MRKYILVFEYDSKKFMDVNKIIVFKKNLELIKQKGDSINLVFCGDASKEEMATFMSYFNSLVKEKICNISISFKTKEIIYEKGLNNKSVKLSAKNAKEIQNKNFESIIKENYADDENIVIKILPTKDWETIILDLMGE